MDQDNSTQDPKVTSPDEENPGGAPSPRGNPDADGEVVERGEEQLEKVSGN